MTKKKTPADKKAHAPKKHAEKPATETQEVTEADVGSIDDIMDASDVEEFDEEAEYDDLVDEANAEAELEAAKAEAAAVVAVETGRADDTPVFSEAEKSEVVIRSTADLVTHYDAGISHPAPSPDAKGVMVVDGRVVHEGWDFIDDMGGDPELRASSILEPRGRLGEIGCLYQHFLYALTVLTEPSVVVETGVRTGMSTRHILEALARLGRGELHSIDPLYTTTRHALNRITEAVSLKEEHAEGRWTYYPGKSIDEITKIPGPWDMFVHDSDHGFECQLFELEYAWRMVRPGGLIVCDDYVFPTDSPPHGAWDAFLQLHPEIGDVGHLATAAVIVRPPLAEGEESQAKLAPAKIREAAIRATLKVMRDRDEHAVSSYECYLPPEAP